MMVQINAKPLAGFDRPIDMLVDCHRRIEHFLDVLVRVIERYAVRALDAEGRQALAVARQYFAHSAPKHTADEEQSLFPRMRSAGASIGLLEQLQQDHQIAGDLHSRIDLLFDEWLTSGESLADDLRAATSLYIQLAFFWLVVGLGLSSFGELYPHISTAGEPLPHAYFGAMRHALTVGFITTLILGVGQRLLPVLGHTRLAYPRLIVPILLLIAVGNVLRVASEMATIIHPLAFHIMPISSVMEFAALGLFTANVLRTLWPAPDPVSRTGRVHALTSVSVLLAEHPWLEDELLDRGFGYLGRTRSVPTELTFGSLAAGEGQNIEDTIARINALLDSHPRRTDVTGEKPFPLH